MSEPLDGDEGGRLSEVLKSRRDKLDRLRARGVEPFALGFDPDRSLADVRETFGTLEPGAVTDVSVRVAGRIMLLRRQGKLAFATVRDRTGDLQLFLSQDRMGDAFALVDVLDLGD